MLSARYTDIGVAVVEGDLNGVDTTIIVQLFGKPHNCSEFNLVKDKQPITNLRLLRSALYVDIPQEIMTEIKEGLGI